MSEKNGSGFEVNESQRQSWLSIAAVWAGGMICVPCLMIGGVLAGGGLSFGGNACFDSDWLWIDLCLYDLYWHAGL